MPWVIQSQTLADEDDAQEVGLVPSEVQGWSWQLCQPWLLPCQHAEPGSQVPNQPGRSFSQLGAHMDPGSRKHPWTGVSCAYTHDSRITCVTELCPAKHWCSAPAVLEAALLLQCHSGEDVLSTGLETQNCALWHTPGPCTLTKFFRCFLEDFKCSVPGWVGLGANRSRWKCPLLWLGIGTRHALKVSSKPNYSVILWDFSDIWLIYSLPLWLECRSSISAMPGSSVNILIPSSASLFLYRLNTLDRLQWWWCLSRAAVLEPGEAPSGEIQNKPCCYGTDAAFWVGVLL